MSTWVFAQLPGAAIRRDPNETELFKTEQADEGEYSGTDALVREILQNSTDARAGNEPVRVRLAIHSHTDLPPSNRRGHYFSRLQPALKHRDIEFDSDGAPLSERGFLVCEDFGTVGLGGDPLRARDPDSSDTSRQDFFWFWRNIGRSGKTGIDLGRWGLGKTVYRAVSQVGCMLGLTVRREDHQQLLMGQAVLKIHEYEGEEFVPEGYWCDGVNENGLPLPIADADELNRFRSEWQLTRNDEPGLSVVAPYIARELKGTKIVQAVAVHFFLPILRGDLIVEVSAPDSGNVRLDSETIGLQCQQMTWDGPKRTKRHQAPPLEFVRNCDSNRQHVYTSNLVGQSSLPRLDDSSFSPADLEQMRSRFADSELVAATIRIALPRRDGKMDEGELTVSVQRGESGQRYDSYYVREGMTITKLNSTAGRRGIRGLVVVESGPLASLLGDSEGPAHEDWDTSEERPDKTWKTWKGRIKFVRRVIDAMVELLTPKNEDVDFELLSDFFSIDRTANAKPKKKPGKHGQTVQPFASISVKPQRYRIDGLPGGFRLTPTKALPVTVGAILRVSVAYDLPSGNPLNSWSEFDFIFSNDSEIKLTGHGLKAKRQAKNVLILEIQEEEFHLKADGFDRHRDLFVRVDEISEDEPE